MEHVVYQRQNCLMSRPYMKYVYFIIYLNYYNLVYMLFQRCFLSHAFGVLVINNGKPVGSFFKYTQPNESCR